MCECAATCRRGACSGIAGCWCRGLFLPLVHRRRNPPICRKCAWVLVHSTYKHKYNTKSPLHSSIYGGMRSNSLLELELARASLTPLDISPEAKYCLYAQVTITSGKSSAWSIRNSRHRTRLVVNRRPRPRSGWAKKGIFGYVQLIVVARQLQITSSVARDVRECRIDDLRSSVCKPISSCQWVTLRCAKGDGYAR